MYAPLQRKENINHNNKKSDKVKSLSSWNSRGLSLKQNVKQLIHSRSINNNQKSLKKTIQKKLNKDFTNEYSSDRIIQRAPAAQGFAGQDEVFLRQVLDFTIIPTRVRIQDEGEGGINTLYMVDLPANFQCQIHIHEAFDGAINGAHIKSNNGNIRHGMNYVDAILYLENLNDRAGREEFPFEFH